MINWIELQSSNTADLAKYAEQFSLHPYILNDCIKKDLRPKIEDYESHQYLVWFMYLQGQMYEMQFVVTGDTLILITHEMPLGIKSWKDHFQLDINQKNIWHLVHQALDRSTHSTWNELLSLFSKIETFEEKIFKSKSDPQMILNIKKKLVKLDYPLGHLASVVKQLQNFCKPKDDLNWKLRDLHDHSERISRSITQYRAQVVTAIELFWGYQAQRTNKHIKKLSLLASVTVPLTFWTSFWGMNFTAIPFDSKNLFAGAVLIMVASIGIAFWILKSRGYWSDE